MQRCRHEREIHNPLKILIFEKDTFYFNFSILMQTAKTVPG